MPTNMRWMTPPVVLWLAVALAAATARAAEPGAAIDLRTSRVYVFVGKRGLGHEHAVMGSLAAGSIRLGAADQAGRIVFDMQSFRADTPEARQLLRLPGETDADTQRQVNDNMLGPDVLDVARHPTATFDITSARSAPPAANGRPQYDLIGQFTLHGVTRPVAVRVEAEAIGPVVRLWGGFEIKQTDFGMTPYSKFGGVVGVTDELKIYGDIRLAAAPGAPPGTPGVAR